MSTAGVTSYFDGMRALAIDLVGTFIYKPTPHFYRTAADFLAKHASHVTPDRFRRSFRRRYCEHSIGNYETDREFYVAVLADLFLTYDPMVEALIDMYLYGSPAFADASSFLQAMCRSFKLLLPSNSEWPKVHHKPGDFITWNQDPVSSAAWWWEFKVRLGREVGRSLPSGRYYELRYDALTVHPRGECEKLCTFLGSAFDDARLHFHVDRAKPDPGLQLKRAGLPVIPGLRDWQSQMSAEELERFEATADEPIDELNYPRAAPDLRYWTMRRVFVARWPRTFVGAINA